MPKSTKAVKSPEAVSQAVQSNMAMTTYGNLVRKPSPLNVRTIKTKDGMTIAELADSIFVVGLLQNLIVAHEEIDGVLTEKFEVAGGEHRRAALDLLFDTGRIGLDYPVPINIVDKKDATGASLTENTKRTGMHHADMYSAFKRMKDDEGKSIGDIAAVMAVSENTVLRGLRLAGVAPELYELYRAGGISSEQLMALALTDNHERQLSVWNNASSWNNGAHSLRHAIVCDEVPNDDSLALYVGVDAYEAAGGAVRRDLFSEDGECYLMDVELLNSLAVEKLEIEAEAYRAQGWAWVETAVELNHAELRRHGRLVAQRRNPNNAEKKAMKEADKKVDEAILARDQIEEDDEEGYEIADNLADAAIAEKHALAAALLSWTDEIKAASGVLLYLSDGKLDCELGLVRPEDRAQASEVAGGARLEGGKAQKEKPEFSEKLTFNMTAHRSAAIKAVMATRPDVALVSLVHALVTSVFHQYRDELGVQISARTSSFRNHAPELPETLAGKTFDAMHEAWEAKIPSDSDRLFSWLLAQPQEEVLALMAYCTAATIDTTSGNAKDGLGKAFPYMVALNLDMADWWQPTKDTFFGHVPKAKVVETVAAVVSQAAAAPLLTMKKDVLGGEAERLVAGSRWLPSVMQMSQ